jgi:hypothetical protein
MGYKFKILKRNLYIKCKEIQITYAHASVTAEYVASITACISDVQG